ncbi:MAG: hypothetical protein ACKVKK_00795 [Flavobacteriales bacterium]
MDNRSAINIKAPPGSTCRWRITFESVCAGFSFFAIPLTSHTKIRIQLQNKGI